MLCIIFVKNRVGGDSKAPFSHSKKEALRMQNLFLFLTSDAGKA